MTPNYDPMLAAFFATLVPRPDGTIAFNDFAALFRATLPAKQREQATRGAIVASLERLGIPMGRTYTKFLCIVGFSLEAAPALTVDAAGKIREAA